MLDQQSDIFNAPRPEFLPLFQAITISTILLTYRSAGGIPSNAVDNKRILWLTAYSKRLFRSFNRAGVFDQQRIDAENALNPIVQEQYQRCATMRKLEVVYPNMYRLAVVTFKALVHLNAVLITHLPKFRLLDHFDPAMLKVRPPSSQEVWNANKNDFAQNLNGRALIGSLFASDTNNVAYQTLTSISACDFSTGIILGCFIKQQPSETLLELMGRVSPFLAWNFNVQDREGGRMEYEVDALQI